MTLSLRTTVSRVTSSALAIASGLSIGREGPLVEFGGSLGAAIGRRFRVSLDDTRVLVAAGTAAGFAAAYNTPFAAVLFVLETIIGIATPTAVLPTMVATVIAALVTRALVGAGPIYGQRAFEVHGITDLCWLLVLGAAAALVAAGFKMVPRTSRGPDRACVPTATMARDDGRTRGGTSGHLDPRRGRERF